MGISRRHHSRLARGRRPGSFGARLALRLFARIFRLDFMGTPTVREGNFNEANTYLYSILTFYFDRSGAGTPPADYVSNKRHSFGSRDTLTRSPRVCEALDRSFCVASQQNNERDVARRRCSLAMILLMPPP
jgi:hypothetical protein